MRSHPRASKSTTRSAPARSERRIADLGPAIEEPPTPSARSRTSEQLADYLLDIGTTLAAYGCPSYRLEDVIREVARAEGFEAQSFVLPTGLFLRVVPKDGSPGTPIESQRMRRVQEWSVDLDKLTVIDEIFNDVSAKKTSIEEARTRIKKLVAAPPLWPASIVWAASVALSGAAAVFFSGSAVDVLLASVVGGIVGTSRFFLRTSSQRLLAEFLGGLLAAITAWLGSRFLPSVSPDVVLLAGAIALFPGMTFTTGVAEIAQKNLVAGGARLMEAAVTLLLILFGVALVAGLRTMFGVDVVVATTARVSLGLHWQAAALVVASFGFAILFQVPRRWMWAALLSGATGYATTALAVRYLPGHIAAFCAALAVCILANTLARWTNRPVQLFQLPGMMLLVPGSFGFSSLGDFLRGQVVEGAGKAFSMALVSAALVIGVLVANVVMPPRKLL